MANDITVTKNTTSGSERWDVEYTADSSGTVTKTMDTAETILDRDIKVSVTIPGGSATTPATTITSNPTISVNSSTGVITASNSKTQDVTPTVSAGFVTSGTAGTITVSGSNTSNLTTQAAQTIYPSTSDQTIASGKYLTGTQTVKGVLLTNLSAGNIKKDVVVKVGDSADDDRVTSVTGTYEGSGGGGGTVIITDTTDTHGGTVRTITTDPNATIVQSLSVTQNGTYTAPSGQAYSPVTVNVSGGGYTLLGSAEFTVNTTSTTAIDVGTIACGSTAWTDAKFLLATVYDKAGARNGYFLSHTEMLTNVNAATGSTTQLQFIAPILVYVNSSGVLTRQSAYTGVYMTTLTNAGAVSVVAKASSTVAINGTYVCEVWALDYPAGFNPWGE